MISHIVAFILGAMFGVLIMCLLEELEKYGVKTDEELVEKIKEAE